MRSPSLKTVIFVGILLLLLLSFVSAELNKRDPQANDPEQEQPAKGGKAKDPPAEEADEPPAKEADEPPAKEADEPPAKNAKNPPAKEADEPPAKDAKNPPAKDAENPKQPGDAKQPPADGNKVPADQGKNSTEEVPKNIDPNAPAVQVQIVEPKIAKDILYKIGQNITFRWTYSANFTNPPEYILVMSQSLINAKSFFFIKNITTFNDTEAIWETAVNASSLPMAKYKLWIFDENGMDGVPQPGSLQPFSNLQFGLYQPQNNEPFSCPSCIKDAATSITPLFSTIGLTLITIISFFFILI